MYILVVKMKLIFIYIGWILSSYTIWIF